jgi:hypothetical protein
MSTAFRRDENGELPSEFVYSRSGNPTRHALEKCLASLEGGADCAAFSSGMAAANAVFQALEPGSHVVVADGYYGTGKLLIDVFTRWQVECSVVDTSDLSLLRAAMQKNTKLVWIESPTNPMIRVTDLREASAIAHSAGARIVCDNTVGTAVLQRPLELGCDMTMYSATKFLSGHGDVLGGAIVARENDEFFERVRTIQTGAGAVTEGHPNASLQGQGTLGERVEGCVLSGESRGGKGGELSGSPVEPVPRCWKKADADVWRPPLDSSQGWAGSRNEACFACEAVHSRHQPWRNRKFDRASGFGRIAPGPDAGRPPAAIDWSGAS